MGEVPTGFTRNDEGYLKPVLTPEADEDGYLEVRTALEDIEDGESYRQAARSLETTRQTLSRIHQDENRRQWYLNANAEDLRVVEALENVQY